MAMTLSMTLLSPAGLPSLIVPFLVISVMIPIIKVWRRSYSNPGWCAQCAGLQHCWLVLRQQGPGAEPAPHPLQLPQAAGQL